MLEITKIENGQRHQRLQNPRVQFSLPQSHYIKQLSTHYPLLAVHKTPMMRLWRQCHQLEALATTLTQMYRHTSLPTLEIRMQSTRWTVTSKINNYSGALNQLASRLDSLQRGVNSHVDSIGISPISLLESTASHLTTAIVELAKLVGVGKICRWSFR